jgi:hypothetical protein
MFVIVGDNAIGKESRLNRSIIKRRLTFTFISIAIDPDVIAV